MKISSARLSAISRLRASPSTRAKYGACSRSSWFVRSMRSRGAYKLQKLARLSQENCRCFITQVDQGALEG